MPWPLQQFTSRYPCPPLVSSILLYPSQSCLPISSMVFPQIFIHNSESIVHYLFQGFLWIFPTVPHFFYGVEVLAPLQILSFFLAWNQLGINNWNFGGVTQCWHLNTLTLTLMQIEISILNEPAATRTWLSLSESTEEFFMWTVCWADSSMLTTKTWQTILYILEFPTTQATSDLDVRNVFL